MMYGERYYGPGMQASDAHPAPWANVFDMLRTQYAMAMSAPSQEPPPMPVVHYRAPGQIQSPVAGTVGRVSVPMGMGMGEAQAPAGGAGGEVSKNGPAMERLGGDAPEGKG